MNRCYKYRIYPTKIQREALDSIFYFCRFLYNCALEERISFYKRYGKSLSYASQCKQLSDIKNLFPESKNVFSQTLQQVLKQVDTAYSNFFRRVKRKAKAVGFPRFKNKDRFRSILFPQSDLNSFGIKKLENDRLKIFGIGDVKPIWHRPFQGRCKNVRIMKQAEKYYIILCCENVPKETLVPTGKSVGIDLGLTSFITTDQNVKIKHPKPYKTAKEKLAYINRRLALKTRGSNNRKKTILQLQKQYERVSNIRNDFHHKVAKQLVKENDTIFIEKLNIQGMLEAKGFEVNKSNITDASWGNFVSILVYKAESAGRSVIERDPKNTTKTCCKCGNIKEKLTLQDREYNCSNCGNVMDRDHNAAINIRNGLQPQAIPIVLGMSLANGKTFSEANDLSRW
jgi:putative transposase